MSIDTIDTATNERRNDANRPPALSENARQARCQDRGVAPVSAERRCVRDCNWLIALVDLAGSNFARRLFFGG
jgi:hypothetical protein